MISELAEFVRNLPGVYSLRRARQKRRFFFAEQTWGLWGDYASMSEARTHTGDPNGSSYDNDDVVDLNLDYFSRFLVFDYPVAYWLRRIITEEAVDSLVDFGGHVGVKYYSYRDRLQLPDNFKWCVVDVAAMVRRGQQRAAESGTTHLTFFTEVSQAPASPLLFCSGSLPYVEETIDEIIRKMVKRPRYVVINKLAVLPDRQVIALEGFGLRRIPYRVLSLVEFNSRLAALDYEMLDSWDIPERQHSIPFVDHAKAVKSVGQVWRSRV